MIGERDGTRGTTPYTCQDDLLQFSVVEASFRQYSVEIYWLERVVA